MKAAAGIVAFALLGALLQGATLNVPSQYAAIQAAMDAASSGDTVLVAPGTYLENIDFLGKAVYLKSTTGPLVTIIDGGRADSVVRFTNREGPDSVLEGFTLTNGREEDNFPLGGGGIRCESSSPVIAKNIIVDNEAAYGNGGGIYCSLSSAVIEENEVTGNRAGYFGSGICCEHSPVILDGNHIHDNGWFGDEGGGGIFSDTAGAAPPLFINNLIHSNCSYWMGGGIYAAGDCILVNNTITANHGDWDGGGIYGDPDVLITVINSIVWGNTTGSPPVENDLRVVPGGEDKIEVSFCDIHGGWPGEGNIDADPLFKNAAQDDYHLSLNSPCINRGSNEAAQGLDIDGNQRILYGTVDLGADEFEGLPLLSADAYTISAATGGSVTFMLFGDAPNGGRKYVLLGGLSGTVPGTPLPGGAAVLPLNWDLFTDLVLLSLNTPVFQDFLGALTWGSSTGWAILDTQGRLPPGSAGITLYFAYTLLAPFDFVSNPVAIAIVP